jgi:hypothetical protein
VHRWLLRCAASGLHDANITVDLNSGRRAGLVIARADGAPWRKHDWDNWRERAWHPLAVDAGLGRYIKRQGKPALYDGPPPYDLRGSFVSLWCGRDARCSRSPDPAERTSAEQVIRAASQLEGRAMNAIRGETLSGATRWPREWPAQGGKPTGGLEPPTPSLRVCPGCIRLDVVWLYSAVFGGSEVQRCSAACRAGGIRNWYPHGRPTRRLRNPRRGPSGECRS